VLSTVKRNFGRRKGLRVFEVPALEQLLHEAGFEKLRSIAQHMRPCFRFVRRGGNCRQTYFKKRPAGHLEEGTACEGAVTGAQS
jgi:hypothetical protein